MNQLFKIMVIKSVLRASYELDPIVYRDNLHLHKSMHTDNVFIRFIYIKCLHLNISNTITNLHNIPHILLLYYLMIISAI